MEVLTSRTRKCCNWFNVCTRNGKFVYLSMTGRNDVVESNVRMVLLPRITIFSRVTRRMVSSPLMLLLLIPLRNFGPNIFISKEIRRNLILYWYSFTFIILTSNLASNTSTKNICVCFSIQNIWNFAIDTCCSSKFRWTVKIGIDLSCTGLVDIYYWIIWYLCVRYIRRSVYVGVFLYELSMMLLLLYHWKMIYSAYTNMRIYASTVMMNGISFETQQKNTRVHRSNDLNFFNCNLFFLHWLAISAN